MIRNACNNRTKRFLIEAATAMLAVLAFLACEGEYTMVEGTTEAGNPAKVAGRIYDTEGNGTSASVRLIPEAYRSAGPGDAHPFAYGTDAGRDGSFRFEAVASGRFNLEANQAGKGGRLLVRSINIVKDTAFPGSETVARDPATVRLSLIQVAPGSPGYVYVLGTTRVAIPGDGDWMRGWMTLDSMPCGALPPIWFAKAGRPAAEDILLSPGVYVAPGDTVIASLNGVLPKTGVVVINPPILEPPVIEPPVTIPPVIDTPKVDPPVVDTPSVDTLSVTGSSAAVADFPLLVRLDAANFDFSASRHQGRDCKFTDIDGRTLSYAIESWDSAGASAAVWVHLDKVNPGAKANTLYLRVLEGAPDPVSQAPGVFDAQRGWLGVWHFNDYGKDAQYHAWDATRGGSYGGSMSGHGFYYSRNAVAAQGVRFDGTDDGLRVPQTVSAAEAFTATMWFRTETTYGGVLFSFSQGTEGTGSRQIWLDDRGRMNFNVRTGTNSTTRFTTGGAYNDGKWHFVAASFSNGRQALYVDGKLSSEWNGGVTLPDLKGTWNIGYGKVKVEAACMPTSLHFEGEVDEARISSVVRSAAWIRLSYDTQKPR